MNKEQTNSVYSSTKKSHRRYRWLLFFALVVLLSASCFPVWIRHQQQIALLDRIEQAGGISITETVGPQWLRSFLGEQTMRGFDKVVELRVQSPRVTDEWLEKIAKLTNLKVLGLENAQITDAGLVHLNGMSKLESLWLSNTQSSDAGLAHLKILTSLQELTLGNTQVSDAGLVNLKGLTKLEALTLNNTQVSDAGLVHLKKMTTLKFLFIEITQVSNDGVKELQTSLPKCIIFSSINWPNSVD